MNPILMVAFIVVDLFIFGGAAGSYIGAYLKVRQKRYLVPSIGFIIISLVLIMFAITVNIIFVQITAAVLMVTICFMWGISSDKTSKGQMPNDEL